jgi:hypothetical protein
VANDGDGIAAAGITWFKIAEGGATLTFWTVEAPVFSAGSSFSGLIFLLLFVAFAFFLRALRFFGVLTFLLETLRLVLSLSSTTKPLKK